MPETSRTPGTIDPVNQSCFTCSHFQGLIPAGANCGHHRLPPVHKQPRHGCTRWAFNRTADPDIRTVEDWHVRASRDVPGFRLQPDPGIAYRPPLAGADVHRLYYRDPSPASKAMAWEIARQRDLVLRLRDALIELARHPKAAPVLRVYLRRLVEHLADEPCVVERVLAEDARLRATHRSSFRD